jgi:hypothetical protein
MYEAEGSPAYVMSQMGHTSSALALEVYSKLTKRKRDTGARMEALIRGADWARMDTNGADASDSLSARKRKTPPERGFDEAAGQGFEPQLPDPESGVLPLDDPAGRAAL